ncbi:hypothetical protein ICW40_03170 [Actinotalea ferrariae]|uniref:hypothetical protein n=1 Tax=Actinotalea ferrariae TaxID=1386098 RepID=UPI001C8C0B2D|nr:hypothetical protein [Actinotalea ferrariae]MBX9243806.1 hypothetical protein [Actinotalea ferrariae]
MPITVMLTVLTGYLAGARRIVRERVGPANDAGASTLEHVIIILGLIAVAVALVAVVTIAVNRRLDQIT